MILAALCVAGIGLTGCSQEKGGSPEPDVASTPEKPVTPVTPDSGGNPPPTSRPAADPVSEAGLTSESASTAPSTPATTPARLLDVGDTAPDFTLSNIGGDLFQMHSLRGKRVVLEWFNPECPYTRYCHMEGSLKGMSADWTPKGVVWLTINSSAPGLEGHGRDMNGGFKSKYRISNDLLPSTTHRVSKPRDGELLGRTRVSFPMNVYLWEDELLEVLPGLGAPRYEPIKALTFHTRTTSKFYGDDYAVEPPASE